MTTLVEGVIARLAAAVPALVSVQGAAALDRLLDQDLLPQRTPAAFVLWLGDDAAGNTLATGGWRQRVDETVEVVVVHRHAGDATGAAADAALAAVRAAVIAALTGWQPASAATPMAYRRGRLAGMPKGAVILQLDFAAERYLAAA